MKKISLRNAILLLYCIVCFSFMSATDSTIISAANTLTFGGKNIAIDMIDCSTDNSSDGKNRAIAAMNSSTGSACIIQFAVVSPATGTFVTAVDGDALKQGEVVLGTAGDAFDGNFLAKAGQAIMITNTGGKYHATFKDIVMTSDGKDSAKKLSGGFGCD
ncbi:hypothetical protein BH09BAC3_BH09BAC3_30540 [soil metagenome]